MKRNRRRSLRWVIPTLAIFAIGTVWLRLAMIRTTYAIHETEAVLNHLKQEHDEMELKVTALRSPRRLEILAKTRFGLAQPKAEQMIHLETPSK